MLSYITLAYLSDFGSMLLIQQYIHIIGLPLELLVGVHLTDYGAMDTFLTSHISMSLGAKPMYIQWVKKLFQCLAVLQRLK